jgi:hypothetical protein
MWTLFLALACRPPAALPPPPSPPRTEVLWARRDEAASLSEALSLYAHLAAESPDDRWLLGRLTRGWVLHAEAHTPPGAATLAAWEESMRWGEACLSLNADFTALRQKERETETSAARALTAADVPCAYWSARAWEGWLSQQGASTRLLARTVAPAYIARISELAPAHHHGAVDRYWGGYYARLPSFAGRDLDRSQTHYDRARAAAPGFLATDVEAAAGLAVASDDVMAFVSLLEGTLTADAGALPEVLPENRMAQARARTLLDEQSALFPR